MLTSSTLCVFLIILHPSDEQSEERTKGCSGSVLEVNISTFETNVRKLYFNHNLRGLELPKEFDSREQWPYCPNIQKVSDQKNCGGCWAYAATSVMTDRFCIANKGEFNLDISTQDLLECCTSCVGSEEDDEGGCGDGATVRAFEFWQKHGLVSGNEGCKPINIETEEGVPPKLCRNSCTNAFYLGKYQQAKTYASDFFVHFEAFKRDLRLVQAEIMLNGPITAAMDMYESMFEVKGETVLYYKPKMEEETKKPHAVKIIGWDTVNDIPVWVISSSWGRRWCNTGFCYVRRGKNDFNIESYVMAAGLPKIVHIVKVNNATKHSGSSSQAHSLLLSTFMTTYSIVIILILE